MSLFRWLLSATGEDKPVHCRQDSANSRVDDTLAHAKEGYKNSQDVIKFVDTKTAVITGLNTLIGGSLVALLKWSMESEKDSHATLPELASVHPCMVVWFYLLVIGCFIAALVCITAAIWSVIARPRPRHLENKFTVLFPLYRQRDEAAACRTFEEKLKGMTKEQVLLEYEDQIKVVGMILGKKLKHIRIACFALLVELLLFVLAVALLVLMYIADPETLHRCRVAAHDLILVERLVMSN